MFILPKPEDLKTESDVEQKFAWPLLTAPPPHGLGYPSAEVFTKPNIKEFRVGKGASSKLYYPDYVVTVSGLPILALEAKGPDEDLAAATAECRLYAAELNALYQAGVNPCKYCIVTNGLLTQLRSWDSDEILAQFALADVGPVTPSFGEFARLLTLETLRSHASKIHAVVRPPKHFRALNLVGGYTVQSEQIEYNAFGRVLTANFKNIFDPASYEDRLKIVRNAYVGSPRKERYIGEIDRIIRDASPALRCEAPLIDDPANPVEVTNRFKDLPSLRNKIFLLVGSVGAGKSTFVDYFQDRGMPQEIQKQTAWVRIDLNPAPVSPGEIYPWLRRQIIEKIRTTSPDINTLVLENLKKLYRQQIREFDEGEGALFQKDSEQYSMRLADLLARFKQDEALTIQCLEQFLCTGRGRLLIVVLDNCDKRDRDQQLLMFQVAKYIQQEIRCLVILPLRYETYENHRHEPPLDTALKDLVYRIEPPSFHEVLSRRLGLVVSEARQGGPKVLSYHLAGKTVEFPVEKLERFLHAMMGSLFDHKQYGRKIITGLAGWNIRKAFEIFLEFCRSGFIRDEDIFERQVETSRLESLPHGVVSKILLRTNRRNYDSNQSYVKNLFQSDPASPQPCSFLRYWILSWLRVHGGIMGPSGIKGYHPQGDLIRDLLTVGAAPEALRTECAYLARAGCILPEHLRPDFIKDSDLIAITPAGQVHLELAHHDINYLAACSEDAWVTSFQMADAIRQRITQQPYWRGLSWVNALSNASDFSNYLKDTQDKNLRRVPYLPAGQPLVNRMDFDRILSEIARSQHHQQTKSQSAPPDLPELRDEPTSEVH